MPETKKHNLTVAILGGGPTAGYVAAACRDFGVSSVDIFTAQRGVIPQGSFYVHHIPPSWDEYTVPNLQSKPCVIFGLGDESAYATKQYHQEVRYPEKLSTSFPKNLRVTPKIWDFSDIDGYLFLGARWHTRYQFSTDDQIRAMGEQFDVVFHTFPAFNYRSNVPKAILKFPVLTYSLKSPLFQEGWPGFLRSIGVGKSDINDWILTVFSSTNGLLWPKIANWIVYNGTENYEWVRLSYLWDKVHAEFPVDYHEYRSTHITSMQKTGAKLSIQRSLHPLINSSTNQLAENIYPIGRFATWNTKTLIHHNYSNAYGILNKITTTKSN